MNDPLSLKHLLWERDSSLWCVILHSWFVIRQRDEWFYINDSCFVTLMHVSTFVILDSSLWCRIRDSSLWCAISFFTHEGCNELYRCMMFAWERLHDVGHFRTVSQYCSSYLHNHDLPLLPSNQSHMSTCSFLECLCMVVHGKHLCYCIRLRLKLKLVLF